MRISVSILAAVSGILLLLGASPLNAETESSKEETLPAAATPASATVQPEFKSVTVRGLNKVTARTSILDATLGTALRFGNLEIMALGCWKSAPEDQPENAALLEIWETKQDESPSRVFMGWMFSSSPAISSLEHAVYDVSVVRCNPKIEPVVQVPAEKDKAKKSAEPKKAVKEKPKAPETDEDQSEPAPLD